MIHQRLLKSAIALTAVAAVASGLGVMRSGASGTPGPAVTPPVSGAAVAGVCGNVALLAGPSTAPAGAVTVRAGSSIQAAVDAHPEGTTFYLPDALYTLTGPVTPKSRDTFIGGPATVIDGNDTTTSAFKAGRSFGTPWVMADDVTLRHLTVQRFKAHNDQVVVNADAGDGWTIDRVTVADNTGGAVMMGSRNTITNSCLTRNGQYGFNTYRCRGYGSGGCQTSTTVTDLVIERTEISYNDTSQLAINNPNCGCSGGGKFWDVRGARVVDNWVHHNHSVGLWADTNDTDFLFQGNVIEDNHAAGIFYEISYSARIVGNTFRRNAIGQGSRRLANGPGDHFPDGAVYISESGGDAAAVAASRARGETWTQVNADQDVLEIADNVFEDNWNGVVLWESADRYCSSVANTSTNYCTLYYPSWDPTGANTTQCQGMPQGTAIDRCRWKTRNVIVQRNAFSIDRAAVGNGCTESDKHCGRNAVFSQWGSYPAYPGDKVQRAITFGQGNVFRDNVYTGTWGFSAFDQAASSVRSFATWSAAAPANAQTSYNLWASPAQGIGQDAGSAYGGTVAPPSTTTTAAPTTAAPATTAPATTATTAAAPTTAAPAPTTAAPTTTTVRPTTTTVRPTTTTVRPTTTTVRPTTTTVRATTTTLSRRQARRAVLAGATTTARAPVTTVAAATTTRAPSPTTAAPATAATTATTAPSPTLAVTGIVTTAPVTRYEAEAGTWQAPKKVTYGHGWSGTGWLTSWDDPGFVEVVVQAPAAGTYRVGFHYLAPFLPAMLEVHVNGTNAGPVAFPTTPIVGGDWTSWAPAADAGTLVTLAAGTNTIRLVRPVGAGAGVSLDYVTVGAA